MPSKMRSGGTLLIDALRGHGLDVAFGVPGESFLGALDALVDAGDAFRFIVCRHEATASHAAQAHGRVTGKPGVCIVTRGPGASHAVIGMHTAGQDSTPMILIIGLVPREAADRDSWQEIDIHQMFGKLAKRVDVVPEASRMPEYVSRAYTTAMAGVPGPVVLGVPEDVLTELADVMDVPLFASPQPYPAPAELQKFREILAASQRPLAVIGGQGWTQATCTAFQRFAEANGLPVTTAFRRQDLFDNQHPLYAGNAGLGTDPKLVKRFKEADAIFAIGSRLDEITTGGYTLLTAPVPAQRLVHVYAGAEELGNVYAPELAINASVAGFVDALGTLKPVEFAGRKAWADSAHADALARRKRPPTPGPVDMISVMDTIGEKLPPGSATSTGAGNYASWSHRFLEYRTYGTQFSPMSGSMGYGIPAALAFAVEHPDRAIVAFAGDGCFQMSGHELATARQYGLNNIIVIVINNGIYGSIRMHQEKNYPGRVSATDILGPDFVKLAEAYGCHAERVERTEQFAGAFERCLDADVPSVLEIVLDPEILTTEGTLSAIRDRALAQSR